MPLPTLIQAIATIFISGTALYFERVFGLFPMYIFFFLNGLVGYFLFFGFGIETAGASDPQILDRFLKKNFMGWFDYKGI